MSKLLVKRLSENAKLPVRASDGAAGYDLFASCDVHVPARGKAMINTDVTIQLPQGCYGRVAPRSGLAWKNSIDVMAGVIDFDYRGEIKVILFNHSDTVFSVKIGDRIAQLIIEQIFTPEVIDADFSEMTKTDRAEGGFGSTGK